MRRSNCAPSSNPWPRGPHWMPRWPTTPRPVLPLLFGGVSVALVQAFKLIDAELKAVHTREWERTFELFRLLI